jgi:hypothetical protein
VSLTGANSIITISQATLFPQGVQLQGFAADDVTDIESAKILEHLMGVDGVLSFGFVWEPRMQEITLQGNSDSNAVFDQINNQQQAVQDVYPLNGIVILPAIGLTFQLENGGLENYKPMPKVDRLIRPRKYRIVWNKCTPVLS